MKNKISYFWYDKTYLFLTSLFLCLSRTNMQMILQDSLQDSCLNFHESRQSSDQWLLLNLICKIIMIEKNIVDCPVE